MQRTFRIVIAFLLGGIALVGAPSSASAGATGGDFHVTAKPISEHYTDVGRRGESIGDSFDFTERLMQHGDRVGRDTGHCIVKQATRRAFTLQCYVTLVLKGKGQLTVQGAITFTRRSSTDPVLAITGGTGDYAGASGEFTLVDRDNRPDRYRIDLVS